jgi:GNAT superfamily N-acetyltransferase
MQKLEPVELLETDPKKIAEEEKVRFIHKGKEHAVSLVDGSNILQGVYKLAEKLVVLRYWKGGLEGLHASIVDEHGNENSVARVGDAGQFGGLLDYRFIDRPYRRSGVGSKLFSMMEKHYLSVYPEEKNVIRIGSQERDFIRFLLNRGYEPEDKKGCEQVMKEIKAHEAKHGEHRPELEFVSHVLLRKEFPGLGLTDNLLRFHHIEHATKDGVKQLVFPARKVLTKHEEAVLYKKFKKKYDEKFGHLLKPLGTTDLLKRFEPKSRLKRLE